MGTNLNGAYLFSQEQLSEVELAKDVQKLLLTMAEAG